MVISGLKKTHWSSIFCVAIWYVSRLLQMKNYLDSAVKYVLWVWVEWKITKIQWITQKTSWLNSDHTSSSYWFYLHYMLATTPMR